MKNLVFIHGGPGFSDYLSPFFSNLSNEFNCIFYDQLKGPKVTIDDLVNQLDEIINTLKGQVTLVGHSWGATLALEYASRHSAKLNGLVLISSGLNFRHWKEEFEVEKKRLSLENSKPEMIFLSESEREKWTPFLESLWDTFSDDTFDNLFETYIKKHDLTEAFSKLDLPIHYVYGSEDHRFPARLMPELKDVNPRIKTYEIKGAGHFPFLESNLEDILKF